jgi:hypothetical protein
LRYTVQLMRAATSFTDRLLQCALARVAPSGDV